MRPYIKRVEIHNYKTHRNTRITLSEGINSIVGPNGVGKSNIVEAIMFCLGERSPKFLRVSNFNELIYNFRKDLDLSVTLTIVDAEGNEHKFKRIYSPKRGHIYRYNGKNVSRTSYLVNLLKLGGKGFKYLYIRQGDITRWAEASPRELRDIIHEALGIKQYNQKRKEALEKLKEAEMKLEGIQANYNEMQKIVYEFRDLFIAYDTLSNIKSLKTIIEGDILQRELEELLSKKRKYHEIDRKITIKESKVVSRLNDLEDKLNKLRAKNSEVLNLYDKYEKLSRDLNQEILEIMQQENRLREELRKNKLAQIKMEIDYLHNRIREERKRAREEAKEIKSITKILRDYEKEKSKLVKEIESKTRKMEEIEKTLEELEELRKNLLNTYKENIDKNLKSLVEKELIRARKKEIENEIFEISQRIRNYQKSIENLRRRREEHISEIREIRETLNVHRKKMRELSRKIERINVEISNAYKLLNKLDRIIENITREGIHENKYYRDANKVLEVAKKVRLDGVYGILSDLIRGPKPILSLLKDIDVRGWYSIVVKDHETALKILEIAKDLNKEVHVKVADIKNIPEIDDTSVVYILKYPRKIENLVINLYGDINRVTGFEDALDTIKRGKRAIHVDGSFFLYKGGLISSGKILIKLPKDIETLVNVRNKFREVIVRREKYLDTLKREMDKLKREETNKLSKILTIRLTTNFIDKNIKFLNDIIRRLRNKKKLKEESLREYMQIKPEGDDLTLKIENIEKQIEALAKDRKMLKKEVEGIESEVRNFEGEIAKLKGRIEIFRNLNKERLARIGKLNSDIKELQEKIPNLKSIVKDISRNLMNIRQERMKKMNKLAKINNELDRLREINSRINTQISKILDYMKKLREREMRIREKRNFLKSRMFILQKSIEDLQAKLEKYQGKTIPLKNKNVSEKLYENLEEEEKSLPQTSEVVIKWYLERVEPYKIYSTRRAELLQEKEEILNFIREIDIKREEIFFKGFQDIKERFYKMFREVFPDGEVEISLARDGDIDSDVLIYVKFLGKPKILLSTASGGEKTSLILLLLFSIYSVNRDTVFILDEVDAHMDLRVVDNIANIIKAQRKYSQVILVTLPGHDSMVDIADIIIPVTFTGQYSRVIPIKREFLEKIRGD